MPFNFQNWGRTTVSASTPIQTMQNGTAVGSPTIWTYYSNVDAQAAIGAANYFKSQAAVLSVDDLIYACGTDTNVLYEVTVVTLSPTGNTVTVVNANIVGGVTTVTGTPNRITSTGGANPIIDIAATYVGQASITTLGTVTTGTWNASVIAGQYGGTGVANTGKTITVGGNLTTSGAFASTFTMTAATNVTFPTSGTLATTGTLVGVQAFVSGTAQTYTKTAGATNILIKMVGGGGGGGGCTSSAGQGSAGGGGGGGGYVEHFIASAAATYTYTVGAAGTGGTAGNNAGGNGGNSTFSGGTLIANGGTGGGGGASTASISVTGAAGAGGAASGGNILNETSSYGNSGVVFGAAGAGIGIGGAGASSLFGQGGVQIPQVGGGQGGVTGTGYGTAGSGGLSMAGSGNIAGGAGLGGLIVIYEFA